MEELALKGMCRNSSQPQKLLGLFHPRLTLLSPNVQQTPSLREQRASALGEGLEEASGKESSHVVPQAQKFKPGRISQRRAGGSSPR